MNTPSEAIREKAQKMLMLMTLVKARREQGDFKAMLDNLAKLDHEAEEIRKYSIDNGLFEGAVVYVNMTSFVFSVYDDDGFHSVSLPYAINVASGLFLMLRRLELDNPEVIDAEKTAHFIAMSLLHIIMPYVSSLKIKENADVLTQGDVLDAFLDIAAYFQGSFEHLMSVCPQSKMIDSCAPIVNMAKKWVDLDDWHRNLDYGHLFDACMELGDELDKIELKD